MYTSGLPGTLPPSKAHLWLPRSTSGLQGPTLASMTRLWLPSPACDLPSPASPLTSQALPMTSQALSLTYQALPTALNARFWPSPPVSGLRNPPVVSVACGPPLASKVHWVSEAHFEPLRPISGLQGPSLASIAHLWPPRPVCGLRALPLAFSDFAIRRQNMKSEFPPL